MYKLNNTPSKIDTMTAAFGDGSSIAYESRGEDSSSNSSDGSSSSPRRNTRRRNRRRKKQGSQQQNSNYRKHPTKATSTKPHDAPMKKRDIYFAMDCEMVGVGENGLDSALARVSIVNWDNKVVLDTFVRVTVPVLDFRTFVSGVRREDIESNSAMSLKDVRELVQNIICGKVLIGHGLQNDLNAIGITHPWTDIRDTATYEPFMKVSSPSPSFDSAPLSPSRERMLRPRKLRDLAWEKLGKQIQVMGKSHCSIEDAMASMDLYKEARNNWEGEMTKQVNPSGNHSPIGPYHYHPTSPQPIVMRHMMSAPPSPYRPVIVHPIRQCNQRQYMHMNNNAQSLAYNQHVQGLNFPILDQTIASLTRNCATPINHVNNFRQIPHTTTSNLSMPLMTSY